MNTAEIQIEREFSTDDHPPTDVVHLAPWPYVRAYCGAVRGDKPLRPGAEPNCVVCLDLRSESPS